MIRTLLALALIAVALAGCGDAPLARQKQTVDGVTIFLEAPAQIKINQEVTMFVTLVASDDRVINGATVSLDLLMPEMPMGQNRPLADGIGGGRYRVRTTYSMLGTWRTTVVAVIAGKQYRATFDQQVGQ